ncbi:uncharacterized protein [Cicer arietinum]|uniref:Uncharacterized protein LOC101500112 isoform X4 n=1 Tax=Cicer arietinum TaxID=3827 RepID=A0A1S3E7D9_CICAR|nr:uncharacterized protein LOC101500112 isoform X4 [Cicer arietinum]XP_012570936.1 uncharacterized protein LOC101500112 isoform X4 [Cicer arietinum]
MSLRIKAVVDKFVEELKEALNADIQDRIMKDREMQSYIQEREREVAEREAAWKDDLSCREVHKISQANVNTEIIFNCQMGRGRTTTGMVIATLVYLNRIGASAFQEELLKIYTTWRS